MSTAEASTSVDFAIVTALQIERDAIRDRPDGLEVIQEPDSPYTYYLGKVALPALEESYRVVVMMLSDPGNVEAAIGATIAMNRWHPENVIMLGIAGGIAKAGVKKGDVVVARHVHYYEPSKITPAGEQRRADQYFCDRQLWGRAQAYDAADWRENVQVTPPTKRREFMPSVHFGLWPAVSRLLPTKPNSTGFVGRALSSWRWPWREPGLREPSRRSHDAS